MSNQGIRNTTTVFDNPERDRVRLVRHFLFSPYPQLSRFL